jgi:5-dehydro-2-deoxygluconokinase
VGGAPVELPGSRPLRSRRSQLALALRAWPTEHVAKCLVSHHPDDAAACATQQLAQLQGCRQPASRPTASSWSR